MFNFGTLSGAGFLAEPTDFLGAGDSFVSFARAFLRTILADSNLEEDLLLFFVSSFSNVRSSLLSSRESLSNVEFSFSSSAFSNVVFNTAELLRFLLPEN